MLHEYLKHIIVWSSCPELFHYNQSASLFMNQHVLYHESVSINPMCRKLAHDHDSSASQAHRERERAMSLIRRHHLHLEQLILRPGEFRRDLKELEFNPIMDSVRSQCQPLDQLKSNECRRGRHGHVSRVRQDHCRSDLNGRNHSWLGVVTVKDLKLSVLHF